ALGFLSLALVAIMTLAAGARAMAGDASAARLGQKIISAAITAVIVAVLEEVLFRGALFGALRKVMAWVPALILSSMIYAIAHFMESAKMNGPVFWYSGLELLPRMLRGFLNWQEIIPGFFNLTLAGVL